MDNVITLYYDKYVGAVNKNVFGNSFLGYDLPRWPLTRYDYPDYGAGIWNPKFEKPVQEVVDLAKSAGVSIIRFTTGDFYDWKNAIGSKREHFLFGIDEYMKTISEIGAEPLIMVAYHTGNEQDASDLVEYLNSPSDGNHRWADERARNGHPKPYGVKYFEFGNEVMHGDDVGLDGVGVEEYAEKYLSYREAMRKIDPSIRLGAVSAVMDQENWDNKLIDRIGSKVDFLIMHTYPPYVNNNGIHNKIEAENLFKLVLALPGIDDELYFSETLNFIKEKSGRTDVGFAITEYNGGFVQEDPVPYRFSLGTALINAELLRIFMKPSNKVLLATHWNFINSYFGMIKIEDYIRREAFVNLRKANRLAYIKRPNYFVYELYNNHFGDMLIDVEVKSKSYSIQGIETYLRDFNKRGKHFSGGAIIENNLLSDNWDILECIGVDAADKNGTLELGFNDSMKLNYFHAKKKTGIQPDTYYLLSGYIKTKGINEEGIYLEIGDGRGWPETKSAATTMRIPGTRDWTYVDVLYKTLPDAKTIHVMARRIGIKGPLKGKAWFKELKLKKYIIPVNATPYLSVNASISKERDKVYLIVINKNMFESESALIKLSSFPLSVQSVAASSVSTENGSDLLPPENLSVKSLEILTKRTLKAEAWILNGPSVSATNEKSENNVKMTHSEIKMDSNSFNFSFEPHSLTAIEISAYH